MRGRAAATLCAGLLALLLGAGEAGAVYQCGDQKDDCQCGMNNPYPCCSNGGNCTWWAWEAACCNWKVGLPGWGNANQWAGNAKAHPSYEVLSKPVVGSIGVKASGSYGHVVWVTKVSGSTITVTEMNCWGNYGMRSRTYSASYFDGGFIVRKNQCQCTPGKKQSQSCGNCGSQSRTCGTNCNWGSWGSCSGGGVCAPGKKESQPCANCGTESRTCTSKCVWGSWGSCSGAGPCKPGTSESQSCVDGGERSRVCDKSCQWSAWGPCSGPDGGATLPDLSSGADAPAGRDLSRRESGAQSGDLPPSGTLPGAGTTVQGGCTAAPTPRAPLPLLLLLALAALRRRRP